MRSLHKYGQSSKIHFLSKKLIFTNRPYMQKSQCIITLKIHNSKDYLRQQILLI
ncbi:hypothetical protein BSPLISOX_1153 [uncultured Gammaproteobacteria bacterium]|nr:hypothetical protein [uncultured Gammaproteobacteria bacterium]VVH65884.1 hypothetical protein BSPLISOX_1153 [uncultured Gammaproteobacteria bacterium]